MVIDFTLGVFVGVVIVSTLVVVAVIILEPSGYRRAGPAQAEAGNTQERKRFSGWKNNPVALRIMRAWGKSDESVGTDRFPAQTPTVDSRESNINDVSLPVDEDERLNDLINNLKPDEDVKSAPEEEIDTSGIGTAPGGQVEKSASIGAEDNEKDNKGGVEMVDISHQEEEEPTKYSLGEDDGHPQKMGDWASAFTDIQAEESQAGKLAKSLGNVDIYDLLARCQTLTKSNKKRNP